MPSVADSGTVSANDGIGDQLMDAWQVHHPGPLATSRLQRVRILVPEPAAGEVLVKVVACGVCRTDLHVVMGDLQPHRSPATPGREVVVRVVRSGPGATRFGPGERIGIAWLRHTCGICRFCRSGRENLCLNLRFTGLDDDGGYSEYATVPEAYAYRLPDQFDDVTAAALLCAGIIGFRALERAEVPLAGGSASTTSGYLRISCRDRDSPRGNGSRRHEIRDSPPARARDRMRVSRR